jgi:hypothetical protein
MRHRAVPNTFGPRHYNNRTRDSCWLSMVSFMCGARAPLLFSFLFLGVRGGHGATIGHARTIRHGAEGWLHANTEPPSDSVRAGVGR